MNMQSDDDLASQNTALAYELLGHAHVACDEPIGRAAALLTAGCLALEREVGSAAAQGALVAMLEPIVAAWQVDAVLGGGK